MIEQRLVHPNDFHFLVCNHKRITGAVENVSEIRFTFLYLIDELRQCPGAFCDQFLKPGPVSLQLHLPVIFFN